MVILAVYLVLLNIIGIVVMGVDKHRAKQHVWRIPERILFLTAILGGSVGTILGMWLFRHKTRHWYFVFGLPAILVLQIILGVVLFSRIG